MGKYAMYNDTSMIYSSLQIQYMYDHNFDMFAMSNKKIVYSFYVKLIRLNVLLYNSRLVLFLLKISSKQKILYKS
jgi:hypothetical protein